MQKLYSRMKRIVFSTLFLFFFFSRAQAANLIGHWGFEEGSGEIAGDSSTNQLDGQIYNGEYVQGKIGHFALDFNGQNTYVEIGYSPLLNPDSVSISLWFKPRGTQLSEADLLDKGHGGNTNPYYSGYVLQYDGSHHNTINAIYGNGSNFPSLNTGGDFLDNKWHHLVAILGADDIALYMDNQLINQIPGQGAITDNDSPLYIGRHRHIGRYFNGLIDDLCFYDGPISRSEIANLYYQGSFYARSSWPSIHRDSQNSDYLPFSTTSLIENKWAGLNGEYTAMLTSVSTGPEGNIYFTTGKSEGYGNLHAYNQQGNELWRSSNLDIGAFTSTPLIDRQGDIYLGDTDEFFAFRANGIAKWKTTGVEGPFASAAFSPEGYVIAIGGYGKVYAIDPKDGHLAADPLDLPGLPPNANVITAPSSLWKCPYCDGNPGTVMVESGESLTVNDIFNGLFGYKFKITNTPAVHPRNGKIYIVGTIKSSVPPFALGKFYVIDFIPEEHGHPGSLQLIAEKGIGPGSGASPVISSDGGHIYAPDGSGILHTFDVNGNEIWSLKVGVHPSSPGTGPDGTIYTVDGSSLYAIKDLGTSGIKLWQTDLFPKIRERLAVTLPGNAVVRCNSVVSASKNLLYLTVASGYEKLFLGQTKPVFFPMESLLVVMKPPSSVSVPGTAIDPENIIEACLVLPDTTESVIALDKNGKVMVVHASINSSIAYSIAKSFNLPSLKPVGGITVLEPIRIPGDLDSNWCVDRQDFQLLTARLNNSSTSFDPFFDLNGDGKVSIADARKLVTLFTNPRGTPCN